MLIDRAWFNSPEMLGMYRLPTVATFYHFETEEAAKQVKKEFWKTGCTFGSFLL